MATPAMPKAPQSASPVITAMTLPMNPADVARALDILSNFFFVDMGLHPDDYNEFKQLTTRIRNSVNNA